MNIDDISVILQHMNLKLESKRPTEDIQDADLRRFKDKWLFVVTLVAIALVFSVCTGFIIVNPNSSHAGIALNGIIGLTMALAGYYIRGINI